MRPILKRMVQTTVPTPIRPTFYAVWKGCRRKKSYNSPEQAQKAVDSVLKTGHDTNPNRPLRPYKCDVCYAWHIGHNGLPERQAA